jgi:hypothetical protein
MATVLGLAMKITADASGLQKSLTPVDRALQKLGEQASASASLFDKFLGSTSGASAAQRQVATDIAFLTSALKTGQVTAQQFAEEFAKIQTAASGTAAAFAEGQRLTEQFASAQERQASTTQRLAQLYDLGAISLETYNRASAASLGLNEQAARSEQERASLSARAAQLQEQARSPLERYDAQVQELVTHLNTGSLTQQQFNTLVAQATQTFVRAESAAKGYDAAVEQAGKKGNLAFNELAGTLAVLPGPIGNVAGRLSGISSAAEGLNRIFSNGGGIGQFGAAIAGLVNPTTLALGGLAAFGAGAVAVGRGLVQLEGEVERLGQLAERLGVSFGFVQVLETAANQTGTSVEALGGSFTKFLRSVDDARDGGKNAAAAFRTLGLSTEDVRNADPETLFTQAAQAIAKIEDPAKRAATAAALFGKSGAELLPVFRQLGAAAADLDRVGNILTDQQRAQIDLFGDSLDRLGVAAQGFERQLTVSFASGATGAVDALAEIIGSINSFTKAASAAAEGPLKALRNALLATGLFKPLDELDDGKNRLDEVRQAAERLKQVEVANIVTVDQFEAAQRLAKTLDDLKAASEDFGANQELAAAAAGKAIDLFSKEAEAAGMSADNIKAFADSADADFKRFIDGINRVADESKKAAEEREQAIQRLIQADAQRADAFIRQNGLSNENEAAENLLAITRQIDEAETAIVQARAKGDAEAEKAAMRRLQILDQAQAAAQDTLDFGFNANDIQQAIRGAQDELDAVIAKAGEFGQAGVQAGLEFQRGIERAKGQLDGGLIDPKGFDAAIQKQQQLFDDRIKRLEEIRNFELQILEERASIEEDRLAALRRTAQQPLQVADIRTQEGASELVRLATGREDPAIEEYRKQLDQLRKLEAKLDRLGAVPVEIMGG